MIVIDARPLGPSYTFILFFFFILRHHPRSPLFPYTTLFRSRRSRRRAFSCPPACRRCATRRSRRTDGPRLRRVAQRLQAGGDRKSTRLNFSHLGISYAVFCLKKKKNIDK